MIKLSLFQQYSILLFLIIFCLSSNVYFNVYENSAGVINWDEETIILKNNEIKILSKSEFIIINENNIFIEFKYANNSSSDFNIKLDQIKLFVGRDIIYIDINNAIPISNYYSGSKIYEIKYNLIILTSLIDTKISTQFYYSIESEINDISLNLIHEGDTNVKFAISYLKILFVFLLFISLIYFKKKLIDFDKFDEVSNREKLLVDIGLKFITEKLILFLVWSLIFTLTIKVRVSFFGLLFFMLLVFSFDVLILSQDKYLKKIDEEYQQFFKTTYDKILLKKFIQPLIIVIIISIFLNQAFINILLVIMSVIEIFTKWRLYD